MKRFFDILFGLILFSILSPLLLIISLVIKVDSKGPVLFSQRRIGRNNKEFILYKFRTMRTGAPNVATHLLKDPQSYITPFGNFLRKSSLDELPQFLNIIKGDMTTEDHKGVKPQHVVCVDKRPTTYSILPKMYALRKYLGEITTEDHKGVKPQHVVCVNKRPTTYSVLPKMYALRKYLGEIMAGDRKWIFKRGCIGAVCA